MQPFKIRQAALKQAQGGNAINIKVHHDPPKVNMTSITSPIHHTVDFPSDTNFAPRPTDEEGSESCAPPPAQSRDHDNKVGQVITMPTLRCLLFFNAAHIRPSCFSSFVSNTFFSLCLAGHLSRNIVPSIFRLATANMAKRSVPPTSHGFSADPTAAPDYFLLPSDAPRKPFRRASWAAVLVECLFWEHRSSMCYRARTHPDSSKSPGSSRGRIANTSRGGFSLQIQLWLDENNASR